MKYIKTYENLLKGKDINRILSELENKPTNEKIQALIKIQAFDKLPRNEYGICVCDGDLDLNDCELVSLPNNLTVNGDLDFGWNNLDTIPENLTVNGELSCQYNQISKIPNSLVCNGDLYIGYNSLTRLPDNFKVNGHLVCDNNELVCLPENLIVNGDMWCGDQQNDLDYDILELPKSAKIKGEFHNEDRY